MASRLTIITHEFPPFAGGMATYAAGIAGVVASRNIDLTVIAPRYDRPTPALPYPVLTMLRHHNLSPMRFLRLFAALLRQPKGTFLFGVDIRSAFVLYAVHLVTGRRYGMMIHGSEVLKLRRTGPVARFARAAYCRALFISANSQATADIFSQHVKTATPPRVAHLGVEPRWFAPAPAAFASAELSAFMAQRKCICTVGRLEDRKGHKQVLSALARLKSEGERDIGYVAAGPTIDNEYRQELVAMAAAENIPVLFAGVLSEPDLMRLYAQSSAHVLAAISLPNKIEGFGLVLLEAAAQACPSIATQVGGIPEVIRDGKTGFLVEDGDIAGLAAAIRALLSSAETRDRMGLSARDHAHHFTWEACAETTFDGILPL